MKKILFSFVFLLLYSSFLFAQENRPLKLLEIPLPPVPNEIRNTKVQGTVIVRVEFLANGKIGKVIAIRELPYGLTEDIVDFAKKIKFEPKVANSQSVTSFKEISYLFSWSYPGWKVGGRLGGDKSGGKLPKVSLRTAKAKAIVKKVADKLGGDKYLQIKNSVGRGRFSVIKKGVIASFQSFVDVIVYPNKERSDFKEQGSKTVQVNSGDTGWIYQEHLESFRDQKEREIANFKRSMRTHYNYLLRSNWEKEAILSYVGRRRASLGKRNNVVKLTFKNGLEVEYEFSDESLPMKTLYKRFDTDNKEIIEEERYAQFLDTKGVLIPHIIDHYTNNEHAYRASYESFEYNKRIPDSIFVKPSSTKKLRKKLKL